MVRRADDYALYLTIAERTGAILPALHFRPFVFRVLTLPVDMSSTPWMAVGALCLATLCFASPLSAQSNAASDDDDDGVRVFRGYRFDLNAATLIADYERFNWDADYGGDIDVIDFGTGRFIFLANFEAILGEELRAFDVNQGNYILEGTVTHRLGSTEIGGTFHHVSRHVSDRPKNFPIDWNMVGAQVWHRIDVNRIHLDVGARAFRTTQRSFVDYAGEFGGYARLRYRLKERLAVIASADAVYRPTDPSVVGRSGGSGGSIEGGVRFEGDAVAVELFVAVERRVDADPFDRLPRTWGMAGFRLLARE